MVNLKRAKKLPRLFLGLLISLGWSFLLPIQNATANSSGVYPSDPYQAMQIQYNLTGAHCYEVQELTFADHVVLNVYCTNLGEPVSLSVVALDNNPTSPGVQSHLRLSAVQQPAVVTKDIYFDHPGSGSGEVGLTPVVNSPAPETVYLKADLKHMDAVSNWQIQVSFIIQPMDITLELLYPVGPSPKVFMHGWLFGARCINNQTQTDLSDQVAWSGTGSFQPALGPQSRPNFSAAGSNTITLTYALGSLKFQKDFTVAAVSPDNYAKMGNYALCRADSHGCIACPHSVQGPVMSGSPTVVVRDMPAARKGDTGVHAACCGPNTFVIAEGDPEVLIDGKPAARFGDKTQHCGGVGKLVRFYDPAPVYQLLLGD